MFCRKWIQPCTLKQVNKICCNSDNLQGLPHQPPVFPAMRVLDIIYLASEGTIESCRIQYDVQKTFWEHWNCWRERVKFTLIYTSPHQITFNWFLLQHIQVGQVPKDSLIMTFTELRCRELQQSLKLGIKSPIKMPKSKGESSLSRTKLCM